MSPHPPRRGAIEEHNARLLEPLLPQRVNTLTPEQIDHANRASTQMALAMARSGKPFYEGTVATATKLHRRAKNKAARRARATARRAVR